MNLLPDTHAMLWFFWDDPQLSGHAKQLITDPANHKFVSIASCWEVAVKVAVGKIQLSESSRTFLPREIARNNFDLLPISIEHVTNIESLPMHHRDPFDRLLTSILTR